MLLTLEKSVNLQLFSNRGSEYHVVNHVAARHCTVESFSAGARGSMFLLLQDLPKLRLLYDVDKSCQNILTTVGFTKTRAFLYKSRYNISTTVVVTKTRTFLYKSR